MAWLRAQGELSATSILTSLPDVSETPLKFEDWKRWFVECAQLVVEKCPADGLVIFYQTDIKRAGTWVDKGYLCTRGAEAAGASLLWHKIACRKPAGTVTFGRPAYAHLLCFSKGLRLGAAQATADVLPEIGEMTWSRAIGLTACRVAARYVAERTQSRTLLDPFCGVGTVLAVANELGLDAVGVDLSAKRCRKARTLRLPRDSG